MLKGINRDNRIYMLANFLFALSYGLWMNLRQLHLGDLGATPAEIGTVFALIAIAGGLLPIPAGILADRHGPRQVIVAAWLLAALGTLTAALAPTWSLAGLGYVIFMLCIAANPATVSFVLLNTRGQDDAGSAERVLGTVFASWPAAMVFAPAVGGVIADQFGMPVVHAIGGFGFLAAIGALLVTADIRPDARRQASYGRNLTRNRLFIAFAICYPLVIMALYLGYVLAPIYLADQRGLSKGAIGLLFSTFSVGTLAFRTVIIRLNHRMSFLALMTATWLGILLLWQTRGPLWYGLAFVGLGAISTMWVLIVARVGRAVADQDRGLALGVIETLGYAAVALVSWAAGHLYGRTPTHDLPMIAGLIAMPVVLALWMALPFERWSLERTRELSAPALSDTRAA